MIKRSVKLFTCTFVAISLSISLFANINAENSTVSKLPIPSGSSSVSQPTGSVGNLKVLNWAGFKGAVSYSFDDANSSQINNYSKMNALGVPFTFYLISSKSESSNSIWKQALKDGHEIANHTQTHPQNASTSDIDACTSFITQNFGIKPYTFAAPYGNTSYVSPSQSRFLLNRGTSGGSIAPNSNNNPFDLPCTLPATGASASALTSPASSARSAGTWQIYCLHGFSGGSDGAYQPVGISEFTSSVSQVKGYGDVWIGTMVDVGAYWRAQKMFSSVTPTTSNGVITYKWTLPSNFPTGKYLRVTVSGGTLKQNNQVVKWDSHGYYEISLDAGALTIDSSSTQTTSVPPTTIAPPTTNVSTTTPATTMGSLGDINQDGKITSTDVALCTRYVIGSMDFTGSQIALADMNRDGRISSSDASLIERIVLGKS